MSVYNEILAARFARAMQKLFSMKGSPPVRQLGGEIMPVLPLFFGSESRYLEGWNRFGASNAIAAGGAGNFAAFQIHNPAGSNTVVVLERVAILISTTADSWSMRNAISQTDFGTLTAPTALDTRGNPGSSIVISQRNNVASVPGSVFLQIVGVPNTTVDFITTDIMELPLLPNSSYFVNENTANLGFTYSLIWRERQLEESERT